MDLQEYDFSNSESIADLGLRFLTPTEVARIHVFPLDEQHGSSNPFESTITTDNVEPGSSSPEHSSGASLTTVRPFNPRLAQGPEGPFLRFPNKLKALQRYKLLGNSLNVWVVAELLRGVLFADHPGAPRPEYQPANDGGGESNTEKSAARSSNNAESSNGGKHDIITSEEGVSDKTQDDPQEDESAREVKRARVD